MTLAFDNSYARLPERFYARTRPTPVAGPRLIRVNGELAALLGIDADWLAGPEGVAVLAGNAVPEAAASIALAYAGHQFGHFVPQLGDGRALLLGEIVGTDGVRRDVQLKGSGPTEFSRRGDGRAALGPVLREYVVSEAMQALGVPTTRALAAVTTGERVIRETALPGAVLARVARSHVRIGTFQFFAARQDIEAVRLLADHVIGRHHKQARDAERPYLALLEAVAEVQARLVAHWLSIGFVHGVMNTDNCSISGETIDYGPCAFLEEYHPGTVFSSIDRQGRYAFANQPGIALWNLARLADALLPLIDADQERAVALAQDALEKFKGWFEQAFAARLRAKLGLESAEAGDADLAEAFLTLMEEGAADFHLAWRRLADAADGDAAPLLSLFNNPDEVAGWLARWRERSARDGRHAGQAAQIQAARIRAVSPLYVPRNHLVERVIRAGEDAGDFEPFEQLLAVLSDPFTEREGLAEYARPARDDERVLRTFCGT